MTVARIAISLDPELARRVRRAAGRQSTSAWLADAALRKLQSQGLLAVVEDWERKHGTLTDAELAAVRRRERKPRSK
jgi:hypothetical protein